MFFNCRPESVRWFNNCAASIESVTTEPKPQGTEAVEHRQLFIGRVISGTFFKNSDSIRV